MWTTIRHLRRLKSDRRGVSNVIVIVLSLVILVIIASNVVLWSYQMNQLDWEKMQESLEIMDAVRVTNSSWFATQDEYTVNKGSYVSGSYTNTQSIDGQYETFTEESPGASPQNELDFVGVFTIDLPTYPLTHIQTVEIQLTYRADDTGENWYLRTYNWTGLEYSDNDFNSTAGSTPTTEWDYYAVNLTDKFDNYVHDNGTVCVKIVDEGQDSNQTTLDVDFLAVRIVIDATKLTFQNKGSLTSHLVSLWVNNSTEHQRYNLNLFINSGETTSCILIDMALPNKPYTVKVVTERGNAAILSKS